MVTIAVDETGSVNGFADQLLITLKEVISSCKKSPRSDNLLVRIIFFNSTYDNGVNEIHGFKQLSEIDVNGYAELNPAGMTPLYDAVYSSIGAMTTYGKQLLDNDYNVNAIAFIITDGDDNSSVTTIDMIRT